MILRIVRIKKNAHKFRKFGMKIFEKSDPVESEHSPWISIISLSIRFAAIYPNLVPPTRNSPSRRIFYRIPP